VTITTACTAVQPRYNHNYNTAVLLEQDDSKSNYLRLFVSLCFPPQDWIVEEIVRVGVEAAFEHDRVSSVDHVNLALGQHRQKITCQWHTAMFTYCILAYHSFFRSECDRTLRVCYIYLLLNRAQSSNRTSLILWCSAVHHRTNKIDRYNIIL